MTHLQHVRIVPKILRSVKNVQSLTLNYLQTTKPILIFKNKVTMKRNMSNDLNVNIHLWNINSCCKKLNAIKNPINKYNFTVILFLKNQFHTNCNTCKK